MRLLLLLILPVIAYGNAKVEYLREPVQFQLPNATKNKIVKGSILPVGSRLRVGEKGLVVLRGSDGSVVKLETGAALEITKLDPLDKAGETLYSLVKGSAFFKFPKNSARKAGVRTKTAALGVRGTEFFVAHGGSKKNLDVWMCVNEGIVDVSTVKVKTPVTVKAGEGVKLTSGLEVSNPKTLPWTRKLNWEMNPEASNLDNTVSIEEAYASPLNYDID